MPAERAYPLAALIVAHDASAEDAPRVAAIAATAADAGAAPVVVAAPPMLELPNGTRAARTKGQGPVIGALRVGMARLANTGAVAVLIVPHRASEVSLVALLALVDAAQRAAGAIAAIDGASLDSSPLVVPRDAWLELMTLGEQGVDAVAARRSLVRVRLPSG